MDEHKPNPLYLLVENTHKSNNLGPILRCAAAYAIHQVIFVGYEKCSVDGSHGANKHLNILAFPTFEQAVSYLRNECKVHCIIGIMGAGSGDVFYDEMGVQIKEWNEEHLSVLHPEVGKRNVVAEEGNNESILNKISYPIHIRPFYRYHDIDYKDQNFCFLVSKNTRGFPSSHVAICDSYVHIPYVSFPAIKEENRLPLAQRDSLASSSVHSYVPPYRFIDVQSCLSIVLHHFTSWEPNYDDVRSFHRYKFIVNETSKKILHQQRKHENDKKADRRRREKQQMSNAANDVLDGGFLNSLF